MPKIDNQKFYTNALKIFGTTPKGLNWLSAKTQELRFKEILTLLPNNLGEYSLCDAGCGFGDFYHYLELHNNLCHNYIGLDSVSSMVEIAKDRTKKEILHLDITQDKLPIKDYYICSGAMNILTPFETHLFIQNCYNSSRKAFIFNALYGDKKSDTYNYMSKQILESITKQLKVKNMVYKEGYLENDITVMFEK